MRDQTRGNDIESGTLIKVIPRCEKLKEGAGARTPVASLYQDLR